MIDILMPRGSYPRPRQLASGLSPLRWRARPGPSTFSMGHARCAGHALASGNEGPGFSGRLEPSSNTVFAKSELDLWI